MCTEIVRNALIWFVIFHHLGATPCGTMLRLCRMPGTNPALAPPWISTQQHHSTATSQEFEMSVADVMKMVQENDVKFVDFRFTDTRGKEQHVTVPVSAFDEDKFTEGHAFDGSSIAGWKGIQASDKIGRAHV
jgi:hypothetical protein